MFSTHVTVNAQSNNISHAVAASRDNMFQKSLETYCWHESILEIDPLDLSSFYSKIDHNYMSIRYWYKSYNKCTLDIITANNICIIMNFIV